MEAHWIIYENHLVLEEGSNISHPSASDIYSYMNDAEGSLTNRVPDPRTELPGLRFSKIGAQPYIDLSSDLSGNVIFTVYAQRRGKQIVVDIADGTLVDSCVSDGTWFFLFGTNSIIQDIIRGSEIKANGMITLKQYLKVLELNMYSESQVVVNNISMSCMEKPVVNSDNVPDTLKATLFPYQKSGFLWIKTMLDANDGCILGDEMGLGKTMQVITEMLYLKGIGQTPMLVVAPISLLINWKRECEKFAPSLVTHIHHGGNRASNYKDLLDYDVVITSYTTIVSDIHLINMIEWKLVALDEAQNIKNPYSARTKSCKAIKRVRSLAVSGTPFENHVSDIWSLIDFIQPNLLGSLQTYTNAISDDVEGGKRIEPILSALMVRRIVADVAQDLPEKIVSTQPLQMSEAECIQYGKYLSSIKGDIGSSTPSLAMLQKLRIFCTHPNAALDERLDDDPTETSIKYQRFCEIVDEIISRKEKVIVFTSYKRMFEIFKQDVPRRFGMKLWTINGETPVEERQLIVDRFNQLGEPAMLVLNPRAAGTGLNITGANHVIHYNLEWNPSLEDQSSARAYRRGQHKTVFIYRLYYVNTVEQVVNERIERKRDIASNAIVGNDGESQDRADIVKALELIPSITNNNTQI